MAALTRFSVHQPEFCSDCAYLLSSMMQVHRRLRLTVLESVSDSGEMGMVQIMAEQCPLIIESVTNTVDWTNWTGVFAYDVLDQDTPNSLAEALYVAIWQGQDPVPVALEWLSTCPTFPWSMPNDPKL